MTIKDDRPSLADDGEYECVRQIEAGRGIPSAAEAQYPLEPSVLDPRVYVDASQFERELQIRVDPIHGK